MKQATRIWPLALLCAAALLTACGGTPVQQLNGQFDAGEVDAVSYSACAVTEGSLVIDRSLWLTVTACDASTAAFTLSALDWSVRRSYDASVPLGARSHQGSLNVTAGDNPLGVGSGNGSVVITLDIGNDGTDERCWSLTRGAFQGAAG